MAQTVANDMVKDKEKALKAAQNAKSKGGVTIAEKIASEQERKANIQNAEHELAIWQTIASVPEARQQAMAEAQAQADAEAEQKAYGREETVGLPVALEYLLEGGKGSIESAGYFLYGVQAAFPHISAELQRVRDSISSEQLGMTPDSFVASNPHQLQEMRNFVAQSYGDKGVELFDKLTANSTGFIPRDGKEVGLELENLTPVEAQAKAEAERIKAEEARRAEENTPIVEAPLVEATEEVAEPIVEETETTTLPESEEEKESKNSTKSKSRKAPRRAVDAETEILRRLEEEWSDAPKDVKEQIKELADMSVAVTLDDVVYGALEEVKKKNAQYRLLLKDEGVVRGAVNMTGISAKELQKSLGLNAFASRAKGGVSIEKLAEIIYQTMDKNIIGANKIDDTDLRDMLIEAIRTIGKPSDLSYRRDSSRIEMAERLYNDWKEQEERYTEEQASWDAQQEAFEYAEEEWLKAQAKALEDLPEGGFMYIFADEFIQESKIRDIEHGQVNERSDNGDTILQGAQPDNTGRVEDGSEGRAVSEGIGDALHIPTAETSVGRTESAPEWEVGNEAEEVDDTPSLLDVVRTLYSKGKDVASRLFSMKFFDVAQTPKFMQELGLRGDKFTIKYGVIARHLGKDSSHTLTERDWEQLPQALQNPFAISKLTDKTDSYRIYTTLQTESGEFVVVGADVKNAGREIEVNAVSTVFGRRNNANLPKNEEVIYMSKEITPEQSSLLERPNFAQYPTEQELSNGKDTTSSQNSNELEDKNVQPTIGEQVQAAEAEVNTNPTEAQKEAGNYKKGHVQIGTFNVTIEQPKGSVRSGVDKGGKKWEVEMQNTYGYIRGTEGVDGDHIDVFLSDDIDGWDGRQVFVVDQRNADGSFDEHKVMLGFNDINDAETAYMSNYEEGWQGLGAITGVSIENFEKWIASSHRKTKAFAEYKSVKTTEGQSASADKVEQYLSGNLSEENMDLKEDVFYENNADAERYLREFDEEADQEVSFSEVDGNRESGTIATDVAIGMLKDAGVEVVEATDAMAEAVLAKGGVQMMSVPEAKRRADAIENLTPININGNTKTKEELKEDYKNLPSVNKAGNKIQFYVSAFKKIYKEGGLFGQIIPQLDKILEQSVLAYSEADNLGGTKRPDGTIHKAHPNVVSFDNYVGKVTINGKEYYVRTTVKSQRVGAGAHSFFVTEVDVYEKSANGLSVPNFPSGERDHQRIIDAKLQQFFDYANGKANKMQFHIATESTAPFYSNAKKAVLDIKQDKATPQQWVAMLKKNGGLKAGEDAWLGLESWLSGQNGSVTKQEIVDYIDEHAIEIEEVNYGESEVAQFEDSDIYNEWAELGGDEDAFNEMIERYGDDFEMAFLYDEGQLYVADEDAASFFIDKGAETINETRLTYTTGGLTDNREIALTVPTIEPYNQNDDIHFGDAGGGRAVAWVRFGETKTTKRIPDETAKLGYRVAPVRVLVIDEIQSVRHQDGREKGYRNEEVIALENRINSLHEKMYGEGLAPEEYRELTRLREEQCEIIINANPELKAESEKVKELEKEYEALKKDNQSKLDSEGVELARLQTLQEDARSIAEYDRIEKEIQDIKDAADKRKAELNEFFNVTIGNAYDKLHKGIRNDLSKQVYGVPVAPFEKNWHELAMKRMLRYAAENGYDKVAWTTGAQQAARYDMRQQVDNIQVEENNIEEFNDGTPIAKNITINTPRGNKIRYQADAEGNIRGGEYGGKNLKGVVGKELAEKIMQPGSFTIEEEGLAIGGEGMKGFYDKMLPSFVNKYTKKWGAKVGEVTMPSLEEGYQTMHSVDVTPQMKEDVMKGQPMFLRTPNGTVYGWTQGGKVFLTKEGMNAETPIHEYTHLWDKMVQQKNAELWNRGKELLKQTPTWNEVVNDKNYANIAHDEDAVASEVHSRLSGENGAKVLEQMIKDARKDGAMAVAKAASITERIKEWIKDMFAALKETLSAWSKQDLADLSIKDFNNLTLRDLAEGVNPTEFVTEEGDVQFSNDDEIPRLTKKRVEKIFGGIWIRTKQEYAKFVSAVENYAFEEDGEGIAFTDNFLYAYYWNINGQPIPYASVYLNREQSQDIVNQVNQEIKDGRKDKRAKEYFDSIVGLARIFKTSNNADNGNNSSSSNRARNGRLDSSILRKGRYYNTPSLYVKTRRANEIAERFGEGAVSDEGVAMASDPVSKAIGEPRYGRGKKMREYAERQRRLMAQKVQEIAQKLKLDNVEIVTDASTLSGKRSF